MSDLERYRDALDKIARYPRGGVVVKGEASGDRDDMIEIARVALGQRWMQQRRQESRS